MSGFHHHHHHMNHHGFHHHGFRNRLLFLSFGPGYYSPFSGVFVSIFFLLLLTFFIGSIYLSVTYFDNDNDFKNDQKLLENNNNNNNNNNQHFSESDKKLIISLMIIMSIITGGILVALIGPMFLDLFKGKK